MSNKEVICKEFPEYKIYYKRHGHGLICHRDGGPAIEYVNGAKEWWVNGRRHREDGPAVEYFSGTKYYYLNDYSYREEEYWAIVKLGAFI